MKVEQKCCKFPTQYPSRMGNCESNLHTLASYTGASPKVLDFIFATEGVDVQSPQVHYEVKTSDHHPISAIVNGMPIVSWNMEGLCKGGTRLELSKTALSILKGEFSDDKQEAIFLFQELYLKVDIKRLQRDRHSVEGAAIHRMQYLLGEDYTFISDGFTGGIAIPNSYNYEEHNAMFIERPDGSGKKCIVIEVNGLRIVNIHLKSVVMAFNGAQLQQREMQNILAKLENSAMPTVFMGDFNNENPIQLFNAGNTSLPQEFARSTRRLNKVHPFPSQQVSRPRVSKGWFSSWFSKKGGKRRKRGRR